MTQVSIVFERVVVCLETEYPMRGAATTEGEEQQDAEVVIRESASTKPIGLRNCDLKVVASCAYEQTKVPLRERAVQFQRAHIEES